MADQEVKKSSLGMSENVAGLLCYVCGWITGLIFMLIEKESKFVRFHAMQSLVTFLALSVLTLVPLLGIITIPLSFILWIVLMVKAYKGEMFKLPLAGDFAEKQVNK